MTVYLPETHIVLAPIAHPPTLPNPVILPPCFVTGAERNGHMARINHDPFPRKPGALTNEIEVCRIEKADGSDVYFRSKMTWPLGNSQEWVDEFIRLNGPWVSDRLFSEGVGWFDTGFPVFSMLDCGGNLVEVLAGGFKFPGWAAVNYQDFNTGPYHYDYDISPHKVTKQVLVAGTTETKILIDKGEVGGYGDTYIPKVATKQIYHSTIDRDGQNGITFYPDLPIETTLDDVPVIITQYGFHGSNTFVFVSQAKMLVNNVYDWVVIDKWYLGEEMLVIGGLDDKSRGGTMADRRTYCEALKAMPCPPPVIGWTRQS